MIIGYMRPYHEDQSCDNQRLDLNSVYCEQWFKEEHPSSKNRMQLKKMIENLTPGDKVIVGNLFILADSTRHLVEILEEIEAKGAFIQSLKEGIDTSWEGGYPFIYIVKHLVEFQSDVISEKTKRGLQRAEEKGITSGRPKKHDENVRRAIIMYESKKYSLAEIREETGISKTTLYRYLES